MAWVYVCGHEHQILIQPTKPSKQCPAATEHGASGIEPPKYDPSELGGVIPVDTKKPFDVRAVIARVVDGSRFQVCV